MHRTHTCGDLRAEHAGQKVTLSGWVQRTRDLGGMTFVDLRDRYGLTQLALNMDTDEGLCLKARKLGREFVVKVTGDVSSGNEGVRVGLLPMVGQAASGVLRVEPYQHGTLFLSRESPGLRAVRFGDGARLVEHMQAQSARNALDAEGKGPSHVDAIGRGYRAHGCF